MGKTIKIWAVGGSVYKKDNNYSVAHNAIAAQGNTNHFGQFYWAPGDPDYSIQRGIHKLDTRAIPLDAIITGGSFNFQVDFNESNQQFDLVIQKLIPESESPDLTWYNKVYFSGEGGRETIYPTTGGLVTIPFNEEAFLWITKKDYSKLGIRSSNDIAGSAPTGIQYIAYSATPYYYIIYTALPEVTTTKSNNITYNSALCYYRLVNSHDDANCDIRGVCYNKTGNPTIEDEKVEVVGGPFGGPSNYIMQLTGLDPGTKYYFKGYAHNPTGYGYGDELEFTTLTPPPPTLTNIKAEQNSVYARTLLYGDISGEEMPVTERGFEYLIQDTEPGTEDSGVEIKETGEFLFGEYSLKDKTLYDQQYIADNIIWWFRAYCKIVGGEDKHKADSWMKNLPTITTQDMTNIDYNKADGNGNTISEGASELTKRGFEVKHEYSGRLPDSWKFEIAGFEGELESKTRENDIGVIIDFYWAGDLIKTVIETYELSLGAYLITIGQMVWGWPVMDNCLIEGKDYRCRAFVSNEFGTAFGEEVNFSTPSRSYITEDPPTIGELTIIKNEIIGNLPDGIYASRRGFRYGVTESADEFDVHENGNFTNGPYSLMLTDLLPETTYYIVSYIVVKGIVYEGEMEIITTDPEGTEDEDEYPTPHYSPHGQDYREISTKVFAEVSASQGIIDFSGGKKTLSIINHLIQTNAKAKIIALNYLNRFKLAKTRMSVTFPTPLPFEREDTIDFSFGNILFKEDGQGEVYFKNDGEGVLSFMDQITMVIRRISNVGLITTEDSIEYVAVLDLEQ